MHEWMKSKGCKSFWGFFCASVASLTPGSLHGQYEKLGVNKMEVHVGEGADWDGIWGL